MNPARRRHIACTPRPREDPLKLDRELLRRLVAWKLAGHKLIVGSMVKQKIGSIYVEADGVLAVACRKSTRTEFMQHALDEISAQYSKDCLYFYELGIIVDRQNLKASTE